MKPYYLVMTGHEEAPRHETAIEAMKKAEEVAARIPGESVLILQVVGIVSTPSPKASTFWLDSAEDHALKSMQINMDHSRAVIREQEGVIKDLQREIDRLKTL